MKPLSSAKTSIDRLDDGRLRLSIEHDVLHGVTPEMLVWSSPPPPAAPPSLDHPRDNGLGGDGLHPGSSNINYRGGGGGFGAAGARGGHCSGTNGGPAGLTTRAPRW